MWVTWPVTFGGLISSCLKSDGNMHHLPQSHFSTSDTHTLPQWKRMHTFKKPMYTKLHDIHHMKAVIAYSYCHILNSKYRPNAEMRSIKLCYELHSEVISLLEDPQKVVQSVYWNSFILNVHMQGYIQFTLIVSREGTQIISQPHRINCPQTPQNVFKQILDLFCPRFTRVGPSLRWRWPGYIIFYTYFVYVCSNLGFIFHFI